MTGHSDGEQNEQVHEWGEAVPASSGHAESAYSSVAVTGDICSHVSREVDQAAAGPVAAVIRGSH
jgi:hypothetical protein